MHHSVATHTCIYLCAAQGDQPVEKQISRWRQEVFKLLLSLKQSQVAQQQQCHDQAQVQAQLQQQLTAAEDKAALLDSRLFDRRVDLDLANMKIRQTEERLEMATR